MSPFLITTHPFGVDEFNPLGDKGFGSHPLSLVSGFAVQSPHADSSVLDLSGICNHTLLSGDTPGERRNEVVTIFTSLDFFEVEDNF